jgi:hypothetical protein
MVLLSRYEALPTEYREMLRKDKVIHNNTQYYTQNNRKPENLSSSSFPRTQPVLKSRGWELNPYIAALQAAA